MEIMKFVSLIESKKAVYLYDDFQEVVMRAVLEGNDTRYFIKHEGRKEVELPQSSETITDALFAGKEITKKQYEDY